MLERKKIKTVYKYISISILVAWGVYKIFSTPNCNDLLMNEKPKSYKGIVLEKYIDKKNHLNQTILLKHSSQTNKVIIPYRDVSRLYINIKKGDSLVKEPNSLNVNLYREGKLAVFKIDFNCDKKE